ncbi:MAG: hypothetical protein MR833_02740 [Gemmiger formicilis]|uniref:hypothetical protein n=1 Tax=Gemmiger formicilis TaxID=745368 RepID=UPI003FEEB5FE|nr:hypothetical protein [Gemmiger formicilis]
MPDNERLFNIDIEILCSGSSQNTGEKTASLLIEEVKHFFLPICYRASSTVKLQIENRPNASAPQFCPTTLNPTFPYDRIILNMENFTYWCQLIYQFSHEFSHFLIFHQNPDESRNVSWIEETICEAFSLVSLKHFAENWTFFPLPQQAPCFGESIKGYLNNLLAEKGNYKLSSCHCLTELQKINESSQSDRASRLEEMHQLYAAIQKPLDIRALIYYRNYVIPKTILLDGSKYREKYPTSNAIEYLCKLQTAIISN